MRVLPKKIKDLVRELCEADYKNKKSITQEQTRLSEVIQEEGFNIFSEIKKETPSYTIQKNSELRKKLTEDGEPNYKVLEYFKGNSDALHEVIGYYYFGKKKSYKTENHLFYIKLYSAFSEKECDIFVVSRSGKFWILDEEVTNMPLGDYIEKYYCGPSVGAGAKIEKVYSEKNKEHDEVQESLKNIAGELSDISKKNRKVFRYGAITFMDFLGWKGIWQNRNGVRHLDSVSTLINNIKNTIQEYTIGLFPYTSGMEISKFISISDTLAIFTPKIEGCSEVRLIELHARIARYVLEECVKKKYAIRGAISFGRYNTKDSIMIGPGIDECASWHETCDWIGVHLTPSAELIINLSKGTMPSTIEKYDIPVKKGYPKVKYCVRWCVGERQFKALIEEAQALVPEISGKYLNTYDYLQEKRTEDKKWKK
jgi:hypothetical protein